MKRVFLIVLDSFGIGAMPDAESFGDVGVNTLGACATSPKLDIPNMTAAGLGNIDGVTCLPKAAAPTGAFARLTESSMGKDTTIGHWEIAGVISPAHLPQRLPQRGSGCLREGDRPGRPVQPALFRHRRHPGLRRGAAQNRQVDRLHLRRFRVSGGSA